VKFETADFLFTRNQMSAGDIDFLLKLWAGTLAVHGDKPPFESHKDVYSTIDATTLGDVNWKSFSTTYKGTRPQRDVPAWMDATYDVWYRDPHDIIRNMLSNPDFNNEFDYAPFQEHDGEGNHRFQDFMSGNWAWKQGVSTPSFYHRFLPSRIFQDIIAEDPNTHGSMFVPIILGSDKTTVSVATGNNEYWPVYMSIGNIHNNVRRAHRNGVVLLGFLAIPKSTLHP
jgi:Plavaka transposase